MSDFPTSPTRRTFLKASALIGCSAAAWPLMTHVTLASAPGDDRLVVIILRGAMDGLDVVRPVGDKDWAALRTPDLNGNQPPVMLDNFYALNPALGDLMPLWQAGELGFAHAVATPYRNKRSHFDGQDILEAGTGLDVPDLRVRDGWLNRMLQSVPGIEAETAFAVGRDDLKVIGGKARYSSWAPDTRLILSQQSRLLLEQVYHDDPLFAQAGTQAMDLADQLGDDKPMDPRQMRQAAQRADQASALAAFAADRMREKTRIAAFSISGWDTHRRQSGVLRTQLTGLARAILALKKGLGPEWKRTTVLAMTEFGRTARENGTGGTDHGTGGAMLMAGGAIRGGKVYGRWPGLSETALYQRRDLMPTADVRLYAAWAMRGMYGIDRTTLSDKIFPGLDMGDDPRMLL
ncbi:DUF1501 domain-containing protein [Acidimangrovimonas sediminis]|uniref:DUF1501 domain-containing protein n=1 Tax=Acidimangrovimonas sediminis TaxID=2056283 RepID=UPI000C80F66F|nr:DUF1501 domain-containing protein [Acidimangrovimonas sediminis]